MHQVEPYPSHGGQLRQIAERFGIPASQLLDFSANINPDGPPVAVLDAMRDGLTDLSILREYPDLHEAELRKSIARHAGIGMESIAVANGFVPLLEVVLRTLKISSCVLPVPSFVEYRSTLARAGAEIYVHALSAESGFLYESHAMLAGSHDAILLANPQNPSGVCHKTASIRELTLLAQQRNYFVLLDEAFIDYVPEESLITMIDEFPNLILFRSVTKFYGMPGLRVAYAVTNPGLSRLIHENMPPWLITTLAARAAGAALNDGAYVVRSIAANFERRDALQRDLRLLGLFAYPSDANFILFRLPLSVDPDMFWRHMVTKHRIVLRSCSNYEGLSEDHFRVAVRTHSENQSLTMALADTLSVLARQA